MDKNNKSEFQYMFEVCSDGKIHPGAIDNLLSLPEFVEKIRGIEGDINAKTILDIANVVRSEFHTIMNDETLKLEYIASHGKEMWEEWKRRYRTLKNDCRHISKAVNI